MHQSGSFPTLSSTEALSNFTLAGWPLAERLNPLGHSTDRGVVAWAEKHPIPPTFAELGGLKVLFIDAETAQAIPQTFPRRLTRIELEKDSGMITTNSASFIMTAVMTSVFSLGRGRFFGEMHPEHPAPRNSFDDPPSVWETGPDPKEVVAFEARKRLDDVEPWFRFVSSPDQGSSPNIAATGFAQASDGAPSDAVVDHWLKDPDASKLRSRLMKLTLDYGPVSAAELKARVAAAVVLLRETVRHDPAAMSRTHRQATLDALARLSITSDLNEINEILERPEAVAT